MLRGLFLDDERNPKDVTWQKLSQPVDWVIVRTYEEFVDWVNNTDFDVLSLDHDLGTPRSGYDCIKYFVDKCLFTDMPHPYNLPEVFVHSKNPVGKQNISLYWKQARREYDNFFIGSC